MCQDQLQTQRDRITELEHQIKATKTSYATSLKNLEQISEDIHRTRATELGLAPPGRREPGVGAELCDDENAQNEESFTEEYHDRINRQRAYINMKNINTMPIADLINQYENDYSLDTNSVFSEDKDEEDFNQQLDETLNTPKQNGSLSGAVGVITNSHNEPNSAMSSCDNHDLNLEELRQKVKVLAVRPVEGGDGQTKDCWESELNETVNKLDRLMMLQETIVSQSPVNTSNCSRATPTSILTATSTTAIPTTSKNRDIKLKSFYTQPTPINRPIKTVSTNIGSLQTTHVHTTALPPLPPNASSSNTGTTKALLNNSLHAVQQKMDELLPISQTSSVVMQNMKELPLLSRISNEISANTANTVKVLKRRLSLN